MAVSGLSVVGRHKYGVFPLKGGVMNKEDFSSKSQNSLLILKLIVMKKYQYINELPNKLPVFPLNNCLHCCLLLKLKG